MIIYIFQKLVKYFMHNADNSLIVDLTNTLQTPSIEMTWKFIEYRNKYRKVASSNTSCLEAHASFFRLLMKGIFYPYVLCTVPLGFFESSFGVLSGSFGISFGILVVLLMIIWGFFVGFLGKDDFKTSHVFSKRPWTYCG